MPIQQKDAPGPSSQHLLTWVRNALIQTEQEARAEKRKRQVAARQRRSNRKKVAS